MEGMTTFFPALGAGSKTSALYKSEALPPIGWGADVWAIGADVAGLARQA